MDQILRYLKGTPRKGMLLEKNDNRTVEGFVDVDQADSLEDSKSTTTTTATTAHYHY